MPRGRAARRPRWTTTALATAAGLAVSACGAGAPSPVGSFPASPSASPSPTATVSGASSSRPAAPLTDLPAAGAAAAARPAVAVALAGPAPTGLTSADVVFQEFSTSVRYLAVYQSSQASGVGPVTTAQPTDGLLLAVLHPLIGYDGTAESYFVKMLDRQKVTDVSYANHPSAYISGSQGLTTSTAAISAAVRGGTAPPPLFRFRGASSGASTLAVSGVSRPTSVQVTIPGNGTQSWSFDQRADRWQLTSGGPPIRVANLVVQSVSYKGVGRHHSVLIAEPTGSGGAEVFSGSTSGASGGTAVSGTWSKPHPGDVTVYLGSDGAPLAFQPGPTWIILAPQGTQVHASGG